MHTLRRVEDANWNRLKSFDMYSKIQEDYITRTGSGGAVSIITFSILLLLFLSELSSFLAVEVTDHISMDTTRHQKLAISLNVTFPHLRCDDISVDSVDSSGDSQLNIKNGLVKSPLDVNGLPKGKFVPLKGHCYPCYEGTSKTHACCNSCGDLRQAYQANGKDYNTIVYDAEQCQTDIGCQVAGNVRISKVGGNVHIAVGRSTIKKGKHFHEFDQLQAIRGFNTSHTIHSLDFGDRIPGMESALAGTSKVAKHGSFMFHYYIKLVPTTYVSLNGDRSSTHQYSVHDTAKNVMVKKGELSGLPGVYLVYEFNSFMVEKTEVRMPYGHFITSICAILGGVITVATVVNFLLNFGINELMDKTA